MRLPAVYPRLRAFQLDLAGQRVRQRRDRAGFGRVRQAVACRHRAFCPGVFDLNTVRILRQVLYLRFPTVRFVQRHGCAVAQGHRQACRTFAILVVVILPDLLHTSFGLFRLILLGIRNNDSARLSSVIIVAVGYCIRC